MRNVELYSLSCPHFWPVCVQDHISSLPKSHLITVTVQDWGRVNGIHVQWNKTSAAKMPVLYQRVMCWHDTVDFKVGLELLWAHPPPTPHTRNRTSKRPLNSRESESWRVQNRDLRKYVVVRTKLVSENSLFYWWLGYTSRVPRVCICYPSDKTHTEGGQDFTWLVLDYEIMNTKKPRIRGRRLWIRIQSSS